MMAKLRVDFSSIVQSIDKINTNFDHMFELLDGGETLSKNLSNLSLPSPSVSVFDSGFTTSAGPTTGDPSVLSSPTNPGQRHHSTPDLMVVEKPNNEMPKSIKPLFGNSLGLVRLLASDSIDTNQLIREAEQISSSVNDAVESFNEETEAPVEEVRIYETVAVPSERQSSEISDQLNTTVGESVKKSRNVSESDTGIRDRALNGSQKSIYLHKINYCCIRKQV